MAATATMRFGVSSSSTFSSNLAANKPTTRGGKKTLDQRPTLADMKNKTSRIPVNIAKNDLMNQKSNQHACTKGRKAREPAVETSETAKIPSSVTTRYRERTSTVTLEAKRVRGCHKRSLTEQQQKAVAAKLANIPDVDSNDTDVQLCKEYVKDIYSNLLVIEREQYYTIKPDFMACQTEMTSWHRAVLVDWLVLVQRKFHLLQETLHLCIDIMDRYLQVEEVSKTKLQLVGITALFLAAKYEEIYPPSIEEFAYVTADTYSTAQIRNLERHMLSSLDYFLNKPASIHFLRRYSKVAGADTRVHNLAKYILELALLQPELSTTLPSVRGAASFLLAKSLLAPTKTTEQLWTPTLAYYSEYSATDLAKGMKLLRTSLKEGHTHKKFRAIPEKYAVAGLMNVSSLPLLEKL